MVSDPSSGILSEPRVCTLLCELDQQSLMGYDVERAGRESGIPYTQQDGNGLDLALQLLRGEFHGALVLTLFHESFQGSDVSQTLRSRLPDRVFPIVKGQFQQHSRVGEFLDGSVPSPGAVALASDLC